MKPYKCSRLGCKAAAMYVLVSGCIEYMHVNTRWYCTTHWLEMTHDEPEPLRVTCWECYDTTRVFRRADDYVLQRL